MKTKFPSIKQVAEGLRAINANVEGECDVRLQVYEDGEWQLRWGLSDYDQDHRGYWGASSIPGCNPKTGIVARFNSKDVARDLIHQAKEQEACS